MHVHNRGGGVTRRAPPLHLRQDMALSIYEQSEGKQRSARDRAISRMYDRVAVAWATQDGATAELLARTVRLLLTPQRLN